LYTDIVVIGGGITGLSAAWHLQSLGLEYALLEGGGRWGGKLLTVRAALDGQPPFILDAGAESFITRKPDLWELAHEVGLGEALLPLTAQTRGTHILHQGHLHPVPLAPSAFLKSRLLSTRGKLRLLAEPFVRPRRDESDESLADFARRRLGREASMRLVEPILGGIYNADPERQSVMVSRHVGAPVPTSRSRQPPRLRHAGRGCRSTGDDACQPINRRIDVEYASPHCKST
jgi:oxygen-dependent protoporphyrinogen oxidase